MCVAVILVYLLWEKEFMVNLYLTPDPLVGFQWRKGYSGKTMNSIIRLVEHWKLVSL